MPPEPEPELVPAPAPVPVFVFVRCPLSPTPAVEEGSRA